MYGTVDVRDYCYNKTYESLVHVACECFNDTLRLSIVEVVRNLVSQVCDGLRRYAC